MKMPSNPKSVFPHINVGYDAVHIVPIASPSIYWSFLLSVLKFKNRPESPTKKSLW